jgi:Activator of Hsp90 ATPase homolog 1-like protein
MIEPLRLSFELACSQEHAFSTWTERIGDWWPRSHSVSGDPARVVLEPRLGGRLFERTATGDEIAWGEVTLWEPPRRLGYLWHLRRDRTDATDVEITFTERGDRTTRVEIEHRGWERLGDAASWRERNRQAWSTLLPHYKEAVER